MKTVIYLTLALTITITGALSPVAASPGTTHYFSCDDVIEIPQIECEALVALYNSTNGPGWSRHNNWLQNNSPRTWEGVTVFYGHVTELQLYDNLLKGIIPEEIGNLADLQGLFLSNNLLSGSIPPEVGNLAELGYLRMEGNFLEGNIPDTLGNLSSLSYLNLGKNLLYGSIPAQIGNLTKLCYLDLSQNQLTGELPNELNQLTCLGRLYLNENRLSGIIPEYFGSFTFMEELDLSWNQFRGNIPAALGNLNYLTILNLSHNRLQGNLPPEIANLDNLDELILSDNELSGEIPISIGNMQWLGRLDLRNNHLSGTIPVELCTLGGYFIDLSRNELTGSIPNELGSSIRAYIDLSANQLTGTIPPELGNLSLINYLNLSQNQLSGTIPVELGNLAYIQGLYLHENMLEGDIPSSFTNLTGLCDDDECTGRFGFDLDYNMLNIPPGYPDPVDPLQLFLSQKDPDWHLYQGFRQVIGAEGGELTSLDGRTDVLIPAGSLLTDTLFTYIPHPAPPYGTGQLASAHNSFELTAEINTGTPVITFTLPATITLAYHDSDLYSNPEDTLGLYTWDDTGYTWADAVTTCPNGGYARDFINNMLTLPLCHLTDFALLGSPLHRFLPMVAR